MRLELLLTVGVVIFSFIPDKSRQLVGEESSSRTWTERFTFTNCLDMSYGTLACVTKECIKLYLNYVRAIHVHKVRIEATEAAMIKELSKEQSFDQAITRARAQGNATAKRASRQTKHIMGPLVASGWDLFEVLYVGGTLWEGIVRGVGTFLGAYGGGIVGEGKLGWVGFLLGSQLGSWFGGRMGLMTYVTGKGVQFLLNLFHGETKSQLISGDPFL